MGDVRSVNAHLDWLDLPAGRTDAGFCIEMEHTSGVRSQVESSKVNHIEARELRAYGSAGSYRSLGTDVQAQAIFAGLRPADDLAGWGYEVPDRWGVLATAEGDEPVPSEQGRHHDLYTAFAAAIRGEGPQPVPARRGFAPSPCWTRRGPAPISVAVSRSMHARPPPRSLRRLTDLVE